jgi:hypothetical protein
VDRFFGDAGTEGQRAFGLKKPAPLWTAPAFDRCLLLALLYPIVTIFVIWAISGDGGPAQAALGLNPNVPGWSRGLAAAVMGFSSFAIWRGVRARGWKSRVWIAVAGVGAVAVAVVLAVVLAVVFVFAGADANAGGFAIAADISAILLAVPLAVVLAVALAFADAGAAAFAAALAFAVATAFTGAVFAFAEVVAWALAGAFSVAVGGAVGGAVAALSALAIKYRLQRVFLSLFLPATILACLIAAEVSSMGTWGLTGPLLLFLGLLTSLNAPFDWASLGLTRALLRRGLELGGWWPYLLALVDAALAAVIIAVLALIMVIGVQAFDELAVHGGGEPVLPLDDLFDGISENPAEPEYWWAYALLLSSMIPSLINLAIGGMAFTRGIPWLGRLLLQWIPEGKAVPEYKRQPAAIGLTIQMFAGAGLGIAAQALLAWGLIFHLMPSIGLDLLEMARAVAAFDLPARLAQLFAGSF